MTTSQKLRGKWILGFAWILINLVLYVYQYNSAGKSYFGFPLKMYWSWDEKCEVCEGVYYDNIFFNFCFVILSYCALYAINSLRNNSKK
jgi:hypothetical protein